MKRIDFENGTVTRNIFGAALPMLVAQILNLLYNIVDRIYIARIPDVGTAALGAVGLCFPLIVVITAFANLFGSGGAPRFSIYRGKKKNREAEQIMDTSFSMVCVSGLILMAIGLLFARPLLVLFGASRDALVYACPYMMIYLIGTLPSMIAVGMNPFINAQGYSTVGMLSVALGAVANLLLDPLFIFVLGFGVQGAAIATVLSNAVSSALLLRRLLHGDLVRVELKQLRIDPAIFRKIMRIGLPAGIQSAIFSVSNIIIQSAINSLGTVVMAASSAAFNIEIIAYDVLNSFSQACTTFVGQNYGAGKIDRCKKTMLLCLGEDIIASAIAIVLVLLTGKYLLAVFNNDPQVIAIGYSRLLILFGSYIFSLTYEILSGYLRGFGISLVPAILTLFGVCGVRIVWINTVFPLHHTFRSIMLVYPISLATTAVLIFIVLLVYRPSRRFAARTAEKPQA